MYAPGRITYRLAEVAVPVPVVIVATIVVVVLSPMVAKTAFAALARLAEFVAVVVGLPAIVAVVVDITVQLIFPILDVSEASVPVISAGACGAAEKRESAH